ncbi:MAG: DDE transposase family protein [Coleofasciculaceae cyanobacterium SM2_1_6]|nr:DDE transposase family protein [Coleofasciculaceae cyanobacterium SM2_1_6]
MLETTETTWYIVKKLNQTCEIISDQALAAIPAAEILEQWGGFGSRGEAIAKRVGLIRAGKCQPL